jgi:2'-hydroxyisoflavone reductase
MAKLPSRFELDRRSFLLGALGASAALGCRGAVSSAPRVASAELRPAPKRVLILGGTAFLGPEIVQAAEARGHTLTLFNRGKTNPGLFPNIEKLHGDRNKGDLSALKGRQWDVIVDTSGYVPRIVGESAALLSGARQYIYVSSISVYDKPVVGVDESGPVSKLAEASIEKVTEETYGPLKAACERAAEEKMPGKVTVVRPGLIVGPGDPTDRFTYWPVRVKDGGEVLAPGEPADPVQIIDARDLGAWIVHAFEQEHTGIYNAVGPSSKLHVGDFLNEIRSAVGSTASFTWADAAFLKQQNVSPWSDMPVWVPGDGEDAGMASVNCARAIGKGLAFRPLGETARDTLAWWMAQPDARRAKLKAGISRDREREVLAAFHARAPRG